MNYLQIPSAMWPHLSRLSGLQLAIYCDAVTWESQGKNARRSNDTLAEMFAVTSRAISKSVARLVELGLVDLEIGANNIRVIKPRTTVHLNKCSPRTTVHPERVFTPTLNECSGQHGTSVQGSPERVFTLYNHIEEQREEQGEEKSSHATETIDEAETVHDSTRHEPVGTITPATSRKRKRKEREYHDVVMPFDSETFSAAWREWLDYKWAQHRFAYKRKQDEQTALHHLQKNSNGNEQLAIHIIAASIANGWQGLFASSPKKSNMGAGSRSGGYFHSSGKYEHPADVLKDRDIWG